MRKVRAQARLFDDAAIETPHPEGGTYFIRAMDFEEAVDYAQLIMKTDFERDEKGRIVYKTDGNPAKKYAGEPADHIGFAIKLLNRIQDIDVGAGVMVLMRFGKQWRWAPQPEDGSLPDEDDFQDMLSVGGKQLPVLRVLEAWMTTMGTDDFEHEVDTDADGNELVRKKGESDEDYEARKFGTTKVMKPIAENAFAWVTRKSAIYASDRTGVERKN